MGKVNCLLAFKTNQEDFILNKCRNIFPSGQTEGRGKVFFGAESIDLSYFPCRKKKTPMQFCKNILKLSFQLSVQVYSLLGQTEEEKKVFFWRVKEGRLYREINFKGTWLL